jgi:hypothetical protein
MKRTIGTLSLLLINLMAIFFSTGVVSAAAAQVLTVSPADVSTVVQPGSVNHGSIEVLNQGKTSYKFIAYATPYHVSGEDYQPNFTYLPSAPKVVNWFKFSPTHYLINPGQNEVINYTITVPKNTLAGGYYAVAFSQTEVPKSANAVTVNERAGVIFYLEVAGPVIKQGNLLSWHSSFLQTPPLTANLRLNNTGSIYYFSNIHINVRDIFGKLKYSVDTQKALLPQTVRSITLPWPNGPKLGLFKVSGSATIFNRTVNLPNRYVLVMSRPIQIVCLIILISIVLFIAQRLRHRFSKSKNKPNK